MKIFLRIYCFFVGHNWEAQGDMLAPGVPDFKCRVCGKVEGL